MCVNDENFLQNSGESLQTISNRKDLLIKLWLMHINAFVNHIDPERQSLQRLDLITLWQLKRHEINKLIWIDDIRLTKMIVNLQINW